LLLYEADEEEWQVDLAGYEGPIDLLLSLARDRKIDLTVLSISDLADQYLKFISQAKAARLEVAAEYLVMAAWLAYLKSRLLLPRDDPSADGRGASRANTPVRSDPAGQPNADRPAPPWPGLAQAWRSRRPGNQTQRYVDR
jgi:hypothetical protein